MARPRSKHVIEVKATLAARLQGGFTHPGARFFSARAVADRFNISYQTAHRLLAELESEGLLERRQASGSYIPGTRPSLVGVQLVFDPRAQRKESFGAHLLDLFTAALSARSISYEIIYAGPSAELPRDRYPILWECPALIESLAANRRFALCLNDLPPPGLAASFIDVVTTDDFSGGACAADLLPRTPPGRFMILGGPQQDRRSQQRIAGFRARIPTAKAICADSWDFESGLACAPQILSSRPTGVFACSDRLAQALIHYCREQQLTPPPLVGFDNAPIAEQLRLTTIGLPWSEMVAQAITLAQSRLNNSTTPARLISLSHDPITRLTT